MKTGISQSARPMAMQIWNSKKTWTWMLTLLVPLAAMMASLLFPLRSWMNQALVGIMLVWMYVGVILNFS